MEREVAFGKGVRGRVGVGGSDDTLLNCDV